MMQDNQFSPPKQATVVSSVPCIGSQCALWQSHPENEAKRVNFGRCAVGGAQAPWFPDASEDPPSKIVKS